MPHHYRSSRTRGRYVPRSVSHWQRISTRLVGRLSQVEGRPQITLVRLLLLLGMAWYITSPGMVIYAERLSPSAIGIDPLPSLIQDSSQSPPNAEHAAIDLPPSAPALPFADVPRPPVPITGPGFTGQWTMPDGNQYLRARVYQPNGAATFLQRDPMGGSLHRPSSLNRSTYVEGNPVNNIDPTGYELEVSDVYPINDPRRWLGRTQGLSNQTKLPVNAQTRPTELERRYNDSIPGLDALADTKTGEYKSVRLTDTEVGVYTDSINIHTGTNDKHRAFLRDIRNESDSAGRTRFPCMKNDRTARNAFKHAYWTARLAQQFGETLAWKIVAAHESVVDGDGTDEIDRRSRFMDLINDRAGLRIWREHCRTQACTPEQLANYIEADVRKGNMVMMDREGVFHPTSAKLAPHRQWPHDGPCPPTQPAKPRPR